MSNQLYANGRVAVMSTKLLGADKFARLAECQNVSQALKVLAECGYGGSSQFADYEQILNAEADSAIAVLKELCFDSVVVDYFLCKFLYHNAKVLLKRKYMRVQGVEGCFFNVGIDPSEMQKSFVEDDYSACSEFMAEACDEVDAQFANGNRSPQAVDRILDRAMFAEMRFCAKKCREPLIKQLYRWEADTTNLMLLYRLKKAAKDKDSLEQWFVEGGTVSKQLLTELWSTDSAKSALSDKLKKFYSLCVFENNASLAAAENAKRDGRNRLLADFADSLSVQPVVSYFFRKTDEIDKVRYLLIAVKNGVDKEVIKNALK